MNIYRFIKYTLKTFAVCRIQNTPLKHFLFAGYIEYTEPESEDYFITKGKVNLTADMSDLSIVESIS